MSHALRHEPWLYELELDAEGWAPVDDAAFKRLRKRQWATLSSDDLAFAMMAAPISSDTNCATAEFEPLYGHSLPERLKKTPGTPPDALSRHEPAALPAIRSAGLLPMSRHHVHLSVES